MMGRPQVKTDLGQLEKLCAMSKTHSDIAGFFGCSVRTIERRKRRPDFAAAMQRGRELGNIALRQAQWKRAEAGNPTMLIWLGKQYLGQKDKVAERPVFQADDGLPRPA